MGKITGADGIAALKMADVWGTAEALGADDRFQFESAEENRSPENLEANPLGSGRIMANDSQQGATTPVINLEGLAHYNDAKNAALVCFYGGESVVAIGATGAYYHSILHNEAVNPRFVTYARQYATSSVVEAATSVVTRMVQTFNPPPDYARLSFDLLANDILFESTTNSYSTLENSTTLSDTERVVGDPSDEFLINIQSGSALSSPGDRLAIQSLVFTEEKPQESAREYKGSSGNAEPFPSGSPPYTATVTIVLTSVDDVRWFSHARSGSEWKASFTVTGSLVSGSTYKGKVLYFPRLKLIEDPSSPVSSGGINGLTLTFKCLVASSIPSGMADRYPHQVITNTKSSTWYSDV